MNLKQLEAFVKVAEKRSFSKAARDLYLTQPTISAHISALEKELNIKLFVRNTREVGLTEEGEKLYQYARQILNLEKLIYETFGCDDGEHSCIKIAASTIPAQYLLPDILSRYSSLYPKEQFELLESDSEGVIKAVAERMVDIGFTGTVLDKKSCEYVPFFNDELIIMMPNNEKYQQIQQTETGVKWLEKVPIIMREQGSGTRKEAEKQLKRAGIDIRKLNVVGNMENTEVIKQSVKKGIGVTIISRLAAAEDLKWENVLEYPLGETKKVRKLYIVYNKEYPRTKAVKKMMQIAETFGSGIPEERGIY